MAVAWGESERSMEQNRERLEILIHHHIYGQACPILARPSSCPGGPPPSLLDLKSFSPPTASPCRPRSLVPSSSHTGKHSWECKVTEEGRIAGSCKQQLYECGGGRWQSRRMCTHLLLRELQNYNSLLNNHGQENVGSHQKKIAHIQGQRRSPSKMLGVVKSPLESNPIPTRDTWRAQTNLVCTRTQRPHRNWASPVEVRVSSGLLQGQGFWVQQTWVWHNPLGGGCH